MSLCYSAVVMWEPVVRVALIVGIFLPLLEAGMKMIKEAKEAQGALICIFGAAFINPVLGWSFAILLDNTGVLGDTERVRSLSNRDRFVIPLITFIICTGIMAYLGMIPGIYRLVFPC